MIETKTIEIRDKATFIPAIAIRVSPNDWSQDSYLLHRAGYSTECPVVLLSSLLGGKPLHGDCYEWGDRTYTVVHNHLQEHWDEILSGSVLDVEFILGETETAKTSEALTMF